jgi:hypothetical protein
MGYIGHLLSRRWDFKNVLGSSRRREIRWRDRLKDGSSTRLCCGWLRSCWKPQSEGLCATRLAS